MFNPSYRIILKQPREKLYDSSWIRRSMIYLKGTISENIIYKIRIDFTDTAGTYYIHDMFVGMMDIPYVEAILAGDAAGLSVLTRSRTRIS